MGQTTIFYITERGRNLSDKLKSLLPNAESVKYSRPLVEERWIRGDALVFIMAAGIVVRTIAPLLSSKRTDPAVVVLDETGKYAISLAGGHLAGANFLAREIAGLTGGEAVITTASDLSGLPAIDLWAEEHDLVIEDWSMLPLIGTRLVNNGCLRVYADVNIQFPDEFLRVAEPRFADVIITDRANVYEESSECEDACTIESCRVKGQLYLRPRNLALGIGCNSGTSEEEIEATVRKTLEDHNLSFLSIRFISTIDVKADEPGILSFARKYGLDLHTYSSDELNAVPGVSRSEAVFRATGAYAVSEPAALLSAGASDILVPKQKKGNVTVAVAKIHS